MPGAFEWLAPNRVRFLPDSAFPSDSEVAISVDGNPRKIRSVEGGYLEDAVKTTYTTGKLKILDVNLSRQTMTLIEDGEAVRTIPVATGVPGAPTPPGVQNNVAHLFGAGHVTSFRIWSRIAAPAL